jgi:Tubulin/FtsZ family, GTPase domain
LDQKTTFDYRGSGSTISKAIRGVLSSMVKIFQVGLYGCRIGEKILKLSPLPYFCCSRTEILQQHLDDVFNEKPLPKPLFIDLEFQYISLIVTTCSHTKVFWAMTLPASRKEKGMDDIRKLAETYESLKGFLVDHSLAGSLGSGHGSLVLANLKQEQGVHTSQFDQPIRPACQSKIVKEVSSETFKLYFILNRLHVSMWFVD